MKKLIQAAVPMLAGSVVGLLTTPQAKEDYQYFKKPPLSPPKEAFGIVWPLLYTAMGVSRLIIKHSKDNQVALNYFDSQLALNYLWSLLYFKLKLRGTALIESYVLLVAVVATTCKFYQKNKWAGLLLIPYLVWTAYATYLNAGNWYLNKENPQYTA